MSTFPSAQPYPSTDLGDHSLMTKGETVTDGTYIAEGFFLPMTVTWNQLADFNGDGRVDRIYAKRGRDRNGAPSPDHWLVMLNQPSASGDPTQIDWVERHIDISALRAEIRKFHDLRPRIWGPGGLTDWPDNEPGYLPLSRIVTTHESWVDEDLTDPN